MTPYDEGYHAYWAGADYSDCPYQSGTDDCEDWYDGWDAACSEDF